MTMRRSTLLLLCVATASASGCESCLGIDDYQLVPSDGGPAGTGGSPPDSCAPGFATGTLFVSEPAPATSTGALADDSGPCGQALPPGGGIDVLAFEPIRGDCVAHTRIAPMSGAIIEGAPAARYANDGFFYVAASFHGGGVLLPNRCDAGTTLIVSPDSAATSSVLVAKLRRDADAICTVWVRRAWATDTASAGVRVRAVAAEDSGDVAVVGSLGGAGALFEDTTSTSQAQGGAFFARYGSDGSLAGVATLAAPPGALDAAMGVASGAASGSWLVSGNALWETPSCHACSGATNVVGAAGACLGGGGGTGAGGAGGGGGTGGGGGGGAAGAAGAAPDSENAFLWLPSSAAGACARLTTYGTDARGATDQQIGYAASVATVSGACKAFTTGLAGRDAWPLLASAASTTLFDAGGATRDGFVAAFDGGEDVGCTTSGAPSWNLRLTPSQPDAAAFGEHIAAARCSDGVAMSAFVRGAPGGTVGLSICRASGDCEPNVSRLVLAVSAQEQLLVMRMSGDGALAWHGVLAPIDAPPDAGAGTFVDRALDAFATDDRDYAFSVFRTTGPLQLENIEPFGCSDLVAGAPAGTYVVAFDRDGYLDRAQCEWARRIGP